MFFSCLCIEFEGMLNDEVSVAQSKDAYKIKENIPLKIGTSTFMQLQR